MADAYVLKVERRKRKLLAKKLPFLGNGVEMHYIGDENLLRRVSRISELSSVRTVKERLNRDIAEAYSGATGDYIEPDDLFIGVPVMDDDGPNLAFEPGVENLTGSYFLMSLSVEGLYESREMQTLDGVMKNSKAITLREDNSYKTRYATFLLRLEEASENELVFLNAGLVAENERLIYRSGDIFERAVSLEPDTEFVKKMPKGFGSLVSNEGFAVLKFIGRSGIFVPEYFRDYHVKNPKNRRFSYFVQPYELVRLTRALTLPGFRSTDVISSTIRFYDRLSQPVGLTGRSFAGIITREFYLGFSDKLMPTENTGKWGFYADQSDKGMIVYELAPETVIEFISDKLEPEPEEKEDDSFSKALRLFDNFIEEMRDKVREYVMAVNGANREFVNGDVL